MKKALSIALALVLAFSCMTVAFAEDASSSSTTTTTTKVAGPYSCGYCGSTFGSASELTAHLAICDANTDRTTTAAVTTEAIVYKCPYCGLGDFRTAEMYHAHLDTCPEYSANYVDMTISDILTYLLEVVKLDNARLTIIKPIIANIVGYINDFITGLVSSDAGVNGAVADLEAKLGEFNFDLGSGTLKDILTALKAKIKALYCGEPATTAPEIPDSGSSATTGIAVFAAVSIAAAAAYVCTRKKDEE